ncbi:MAG: hypothetical protein ACM3TR_08175 [Caulobacteraceae bacterium]
MEDFFDEVGWVALLVLFILVIGGGESLFGGQDGDKAEETAPETEEKKREPSYIFWSSNRKRMKPKTVYFK